MNRENGSNLYYQLHMILSETDIVKAICNNTEFFCQLADYLFRIAKNICDARLEFTFETTTIFSIASFSEKLPLYRVDIRDIDYNAFAKLMYGQMKCSDFLLDTFGKFGVCKTTENDKPIQVSLTEMSDSWDKYIKRLGYQEDRFFDIDEKNDARNELRSSHILWCYNKSCTGKSFLGINTLNHLGILRFAYNPTVETINDKRFLLITVTHATNCAILIDDLQCDIDLARELLPYLAYHQEDIKQRRVYIFVVSWASLADSPEFSAYQSAIPTIRTRPKKYIALMKEDLHSEELREICGDSLSLINTARTIRPKCNEMHDVDYYEKKLFSCYVRTNEEEQIQLVYILAVLGTYEFETPIRLLSQYGTIDFSIVPTAKISQNQIYLAHRTVSEFLACYIEKNYRMPYARTDIIKQYINQIDSRKKWGVLVHLIGEGAQPTLMSVGPLWSFMYKFQAKLKAQSKKDPTWNNTPSSMCFVILAAEKLGIVDEYVDVIEALCSKFSVVSGHVVINFNELITTNDFVHIKDKMLAEDKIIHPPISEAADSINLDRAHKNWLFGLLIGLKSILIKYGHQDLIDAVEAELLSTQDPEGFWYPKRIPWVSARILIGLATAGFTKTETCIRNGVQYIYSTAHNYFWVANTGGWNNEYETTSLCLEALFKCGEDCDSEFITKAAELLLSKSSVWMKPEYDIDGVISAYALMNILGFEKKLLSYINSLVIRQIHEIIDTSSELDLSQEQSCLVTQIASYVLELCWNLLEKKIPNLLDEYITRAESEGAIMGKKKIFISYADEAKYIERIRRIVQHLKGVYTVFFYEDVKLGENITEFMDKIEESDAILVIGTKRYKEKARKLRAGGAWYEYCVLSQEFMNNHYSRIIPIAFDDFDEALPVIFRTNKGMRVSRVDQKFLRELTNNLKSKFEEDI